MAVTGKITLRNDSNSRKRSLRCRCRPRWHGTASPWTTSRCSGWARTYTSDIDHTGSLSRGHRHPAEAAAARGHRHARRAIWRHHHAGQHAADAHGRARRSGARATTGTRSATASPRFADWAMWCGIRWHIEAVSMSEGNAVFDAIAAWKSRHGCTANSSRASSCWRRATESLCIADQYCRFQLLARGRGASARPSRREAEATFTQSYHHAERRCWTKPFPHSRSAGITNARRPTVTLLHLPDARYLARDYALAAEANDPLLHDWLGDPAAARRGS